jgi:hypothetical protein
VSHKRPKAHSIRSEGRVEKPKVIARPQRAQLDLGARSTLHGCHSERRTGFVKTALCDTLAGAKRGSEHGRLVSDAVAMAVSS